MKHKRFVIVNHGHKQSLAISGGVNIRLYGRPFRYGIPILAKRTRKNYSNEFKLRMVKLHHGPEAARKSR